MCAGRKKNTFSEYSNGFFRRFPLIYVYIMYCIKMKGAEYYGSYEPIICYYYDVMMCVRQTGRLFVSTIFQNIGK